MYIWSLQKYFRKHVTSGLMKKLSALHLALHLLSDKSSQKLCLTNSQDHITPVLKKLYLLPVPQRVQFKILLLTHNRTHTATSPMCPIIITTTGRCPAASAPLMLTSCLHHFTTSTGPSSETLHHI